MRNRRIDIQRFRRDALLRLGRLILQRAHVMETVRNLDQNDADISCHGDEDLPVVGRLVLRIVLAPILQSTDLGHGVDKIRNFRTELSGKLLLTDAGIFNGIVQIAGRNRTRAAMKTCQNIGDIGQMNDIGLP